ncbi:MAG: hypothetical protein ACRDNZ_06310 [Streptosporangiaceae bacterium]
MGRSGHDVGDSGQLTADGSTMLALGDANGSVNLEELSASSGSLRDTTTIAPEAARQSLSYCGILWSSPSGDQVY